MSTPKLPRVGESMIKRYQKTRDGQQHKGCACIICGQNFDDCPHSFTEVDRIITAIELSKVLPKSEPKQLIFFKEAVINIDDVSHAVRTYDFARGINTGAESVMVHFLSAEEPVLLWGVTMEEFQTEVSKARA